jgi:hypothetical protein
MSSGEITADKAKKQRSPNYPAVSLKEAVERVGKIYKADGKVGSPAEAAAKHMGYSGLHGKALTVLSALAKYGLTQNKAGRVVPTSTAISILEYSPDREQNIKARRDAALSPAMYRELVNEFKAHGRLPTDDSLRPDLITKKGFTRKAVGGFLHDFRESLEYAGLLEGNTLKLSPDEGSGGEKNGEDVEIVVGSFVQWASRGIDQFTKPKQVVGITDDRAWAFLEGSPTGVPMSELTVQEQPVTTARTTVPPANPFYAPPRDRDDQDDPSLAQVRTMLDEGPVLLSLPDELSKESVAELEYWMHGVLRRARRKAGLEPESKTDQPDKNKK